MSFLSFIPWRFFRAYRDRTATHDFLADAARTTKKRIVDGIKNPPKTGVWRMKRKGGGPHRASSGRSAKEEYPANDTGALARSARQRIGATEMQVGTTIFYGKFLADGTRRMRARKMTEEAYKDVIPAVRRRMKRWAIWIK